MENVTVKIKVAIAGEGTVDKCDHCGIEFTTGVSCFTKEEWKEIDLCDVCLEKHYEEG